MFALVCVCAVFCWADTPVCPYSAGVFVVIVWANRCVRPGLRCLRRWGSVERFAKELVMYIRDYNSDPIKLGLNGKSPVQYRALFQSKAASW